MTGPGISHFRIKAWNARESLQLAQQRLAGLMRDPRSSTVAAIVAAESIVTKARARVVDAERDLDAAEKASAPVPRAPYARHRAPQIRNQNTHP